MTGRKGPPRLARWLLERGLPADVREDIPGDLEEMFARDCETHGRTRARRRYWGNTLSFSWHFAFERWPDWRQGGVMQLAVSWLDVKLGFRMLRKYPGLTVAGGLALAIAIGIGAGWYDLSRDLFRPTLPLPNADRLVEIEMRDSLAGQDERRVVHDFLTWRREARLIDDWGAYRTLQRNLILGDASPEPVTVAETTASAFRVAPVPPLLGRPLLESDERSGAPPVVVLGYTVWQRLFDGRTDIIGQGVQLGRTATTVVGVMPEGFAFPINHRLWMPLQLGSPAYAPLEGPPIRVFGRVAAGATQAQAYAELMALAERAAAASPHTHQHLRPRVLAYGGESPGDRSWLEFAITHLPVLLVLVVACVNVGTLIYARTATREGEIAMRHALGASRGRILGQLFVEALVLAGVAAVVGLAAADWVLKWGVAAYYSGQGGGAPFWVDPGLKPTTILYAAALAVAGAALLGMLPALKVTRLQAHGQMRNAAAGSATLRFGRVWTTAMIAQVALTVICLPPALGISQEALRDRQIRSRFPAEEYLAVQVGFDRDVATASSREGAAAPEGAGLDLTYAELERRVAAEPGVTAVTFGDRLPGMGPAVRRAEVEVSPGAPPVFVANLWTASIGPRFFEAFDVQLLAGRDFRETDRSAGARTVLVNEAFARRFTNGASPVGRRVRYATAKGGGASEPWLEIVGLVRDVGMTPTDLGEAPYVFRAVSAATAQPLVMGVRVAGDPTALAARLRSIAVSVDPGLRLESVHSLDDLAWRVDVPAVVAAGAVLGVVGLGLFLSAAGIFSLMSVSIARRTREIGLRSALGAGRRRLLAGVFSRAVLLVGSGIAAGNAVLLLFVKLSEEATIADVWGALLTTSCVMFAVGLLACIEPARRALRINPTDALKEV